MRPKIAEINIYNTPQFSPNGGNIVNFVRAKALAPAPKPQARLCLDPGCPGLSRTRSQASRAPGPAWHRTHLFNGEMASGPGWGRNGRQGI